MSEDVMGKLGSFTPAAVDRDALLFAAGRASAKPARFWKLSAVVLAVSQCITLGLWFAPKPETAPPTAPPPAAIPADDPAIPVPDPYSLLAMRRNPHPHSYATDSPMPARPPLLAFARDYQP